MVYAFSNQKISIWANLSMQDVCIFYGHLIYFTAIC
jgi:hypothetical protein